MRYLGLMVALLPAVGVLCATGLADEVPWPVKAPGFVPPKPGEHPRLLFRKADVPALKARAATP